jgi:phosphoribosyl 1,2-cyclic phosphodiesterase
MSDAFKFAELTQVKHLVPFHHDPNHTDDDLDRLLNKQIQASRPTFRVTPGIEGTKFKLDGARPGP